MWNSTLGMNFGTLWNNCSRAEVNVVVCRSEEREKEWILSSKLTFLENGLVNERVFETMNISNITIQLRLLIQIFQLLQNIMKKLELRMVRTRLKRLEIF